MQSSQRLYIHLPEKYEEFKKSGEWDHGIVVTDLNPYLTHSELNNYFEIFGTITECVLTELTLRCVFGTNREFRVYVMFTIDKSSGWPKGVGFVRYSSSEEAKAAEEAGPHCLGGFHLWIRRVVTPKMSVQNRFDSHLNTPPCQSFQTDLCVN